MMASFHDFTLPGIDGSKLPLKQFRGRAVLIVNVASQCLFTPQYAQLQALYEELGPQGLMVIGVPCNQFGGHEPGGNDRIQRFCTARYGVSFPLTAKMAVRGPDRHPFFDWLVGQGPDPVWNFEKFLVDGKGQLVARFPSPIRPDNPGLREAIFRAMTAGPIRLA